MDQYHMKMAPDEQNIEVVAPLHVAGFFLEASGEEGSEGEKGITNLHLNKMVYLAHGNYWGNHKKPLITDGEDPEAWEYGPVYRSIYRMFGRFGSETIPPYMHRSVSDRPVSFGKDIDDFLDQAWNVYGDKDPWNLVNMLHAKGSPWYIVWNLEGGKNSYGKSIPDYLTKAYYIDRIAKLKLKGT